MSRANLSRRQDEALVQMKLLAATVGADPEGYGILPGVAAELVAAVGAFAAAYAAANPQVQRTRAGVVAKDEAFRAAERAYRRVYSLIKWNDAVGDAEKLLAGVRPVNRSRVRARPPEESPAVHVIKATPGVHHLVYRRSVELTGMRKAPSAVQLQLFAAVGDGKAKEPAEARLVGCYTRNPVRVAWRSEQNGKTATYFGRWISRRGEVGPWSLGVSMTVAA